MTVFLVAMPFLAGCCGYTPDGRLATIEESIQFFDGHQSEFLALHDLLLSDPNKDFTVYDAGNYASAEPKSHFYKKRIALYAKKLSELGLPSLCKSTFTTRGKKPVVQLEILLSGMGIAGNGSSRSIIFCKSLVVPNPSDYIKINDAGWYLLSLSGE